MIDNQHGFIACADQAQIILYQGEIFYINLTIKFIWLDRKIWILQGSKTEKHPVS